MSVKTNLPGRLRNTSLPYHEGLLPLFEAVVNSIHAIEETEVTMDQGRIDVEIIRNQLEPDLFEEHAKRPGRDAIPSIRGFIVKDNGIGFNQENMESFMTLDSDHKADKGCRGVGRLLWLKAFEEVKIDSVYQNGGGALHKRKFTFSAKTDIRGEGELQANDTEIRETQVALLGFKKKYQQASRKTLSSIATQIFEHCLWYFIRSGGCPEIHVWDEGESINLDSVYHEHIKNSAIAEQAKINEVDFVFNHVRIRSTNHLNHSIAYCAGSRLVKEEKLNGKIAGLFGKLNDEDGEFTYVCYVTSEFLDQNVRAERTGFDIEEEYEGLLQGIEISMSDIRSKVIEKAQSQLSGFLDSNIMKSKERINHFVSKRAPRYRPILKRIPESKLAVDPEISDKDLDIALHKFLSEMESELLEEGHDIMSPMLGEAEADYSNRLREYLAKATDLKTSDLADYVSHRKVILDLFSEAIKRKVDGTYEREDLIHNLIMPMRKDTDEALPASCNLWLFDERLAFHEYLGSDKTLQKIPITGSSSKKEPDLMALNINDNPFLTSETDSAPFSSLTVIEIKRPMRNDAKPGEDKDPIEQCLGYLKRAREGKVTTKDGRPLSNAENLPGFCYVLCDLTPSVINRCEILDMTRTHDGMGYFHYNKTYNAYVEVISFDKLVLSAKERNRAFFDRLGLPTT
ncbi:ATP-binding protein [Cerasicoccus fimbriatus]|uniref:ATP-binding protein n=1 Tax=Cerasicoccus fimbriatus TaxID=3014554 RepID=UPI0022B3F0D3|nr:ATP-binding protein [Cerasicoccus sp. TK19100]